VSTDSGSTFQQIGESFTGVREQWREITIPLDGLVGYDGVQIRFRMTSDDAQSVPMSGSYIDDVRVVENYITGIISQEPLRLPDYFRLYQNYPNPFNSTTKIGYDLPSTSQVTLTVFDLLGRKVRILVDEHQNAGHYEIAWNGTDNFGWDVPTGVYIVRLKSNGSEQWGKVLLTR